MKQIWNENKIQDWINKHNYNCKVLSIERRKNSILYVYLKCNVCNSEFCKTWEVIKSASCLCKKCKKDNSSFDFLEHEKYLHLTFPNYQLMDIKRKNYKIYYKVKCENGHIYWGYRNHLHNGHGCAHCVHRKVKFWSKEKVIELYKKFNLEIINLDEYSNAESTIYAKNKDGYIIKTIPSTLNRMGVQKSYLYNRYNKYAKYNVDLWCKINRPDYECIKFTAENKRSKCVFLYKGNFIKEENREFECSLEDFMYSGVEHPLLTMSKGEKDISLFLQNNKINFVSQYKFPDCFFKSENSPLRFDFYLPDYNICIEYNGKQHYEAINWFGGSENFKEQKERDKIKKEYCKKNDIKLIEIAYNDNLDAEMDNILKAVNNNAYSGRNN